MVVARTTTGRLDIARRHAREDKNAELRALVDETIAERGPNAETRALLLELAEQADAQGDHALAEVIDEALAELPNKRVDLDLAAELQRELAPEPSRPAHPAIDSALQELARILGTLPPTNAEQRLDHIFDADRDRALRSADLLAQLSDAFGIGDVSLVVDDDAAQKVRAEGAIGLYEDDVVYLDPSHYDASGADDRALLAHELAHAAQAERPSVGAEIGPAEEEAYAIMEDARAGKTLTAPEAALPTDEVAACGPIHWADKDKEKNKDEKDDPKQEDDPKKTGGGGGGGKPEDKKDDPKKTGGGGGGGNQDPGKDPKKDPPKNDTDDPGKTTDPGKDPGKTDEPAQEPGECLDACPDMDAEHAAPEVKTPAPAKPGPGKIIKLNLAGHIINIRLDENAKPGRITVRFRGADSPYKSLRLDTAVIELDDELNVKAGAVKCGIKLGNYVQADNVSLAVRKGGFVAVAIKGAQVNVGSYIHGTVDLNITREGITGRARFTHDKLQLGDGLVVKDGMLDISVEKGGKVTAHGRVTVEVPNLGAVTLDVCFVDGELRGHLTFEWLKPIELAPGIVLERVKLSGCYRKGAWSITGEVEVGLWEKFGATVSGTYFRTGQASYWAFRGDLTQRDVMKLGKLEMDKGHIGVGYKKGKWEPATAHFEVRYEEMKGVVDGTYDIEQKKLDATGKATLERPLKLGKTGATIEEANLEAEIKENELVKIHGDAKVTLPYQRKDTFKVEAQATWFVKEDKVDATGSVTVLRDVVFGQKAGMHATMKEGANGQFVMEQSEVKLLGGDLQFDVHHGKDEIGKGHVNFNGGNASELDGEAHFALTNKTGIPSFKKGPFYLLEGGEFHLSIVKSALGKAEATNVKWELYHPKGLGKVTGEVAGHYDFGTGLATLNGSLLVEEPWQVADAKWGKAQLLAGGSGKVGVVDSKLTELEGKLPFQVDVNPIGKVPAFTVVGEINGKVDPKTWKVDGDFKVGLASPLEIPIGDKGDKVIFQTGSEFSGKMLKGDISELGLQLTIDYHRGAEGLFLQGQVNDGKYDVKKGLLGFHASLTLKRPIEQKLGEKWKLRVEPEVTNLEVDVAANKLTKVSGDIQLSLYDGEAEPLLTGGLVNAVYDFQKEEPEFSGDLFLKLARDVQWPRGGGDMPPAVAIKALKDSGVNAKITKNVLSEATIDIKADVSLFSVKVAEAGLSGKWDLLKSKVSGDGHITLVEDIELGDPAPPESQELTAWRLVFCKNSQVTMKMVDNKLLPATVSIDMALRRGEKDAALGSVKGEYVFGAEAGFDGKMDFHLVEDIPLGKAGRFDVFLGKDTKGDGSVTKSKVTDAKGTFVLVAREGDKDAIHCGIETTYTGGKFNGEAVATVKNPIRLGEKQFGQHNYAVDLGTATQAKVKVTDNAIGAVDGKLEFDVAMDGIPFAKGTFQAAYDFSDPAATVTAEGKFELFASVELGKAGMFTFFLDGGTNISARLEENALAWIDGALELGIATDREGRVGSLSLQGRYDGGDEPKFKGSAGAKITNKFLLGYSAFGYEFGFAPSNFDIMLEDGQITQAGGNIVFVAEQFGSEAEAPLGSLTVTFSGTYDRPLGQAQGNFSGEGKCDVAGQLKVGKAGDYEFFVMGGTGVGITVENNEFTKLHGALKAEVHQLKVKRGEDKRFLGLDCEIDYIPKDGGKINAKGSCSMLGNKEVLHGEKYSFWLIKGDGGTGATVDIVDNQLMSVGGRVSCAVYDGYPEPLIKAHAEGTWDRASNEFSGSGKIELGRDITFPEGATTGPLIKFKKGSGGSGSVEKNIIQKLSGKLECDIWDSKGKLLTLDASGEYDAVNNNVVQAKGKATLHRKIVIGGSSEADALIVLSDISGAGEIKDSKLIAVEGGMKFALPHLKMKGELHGGWTNANGTDEYWGDASLVFDLIKDDKGKGRKLTGSIEGQFNRDGSWNLVGDVAYALTPKIKTRAHVEMDQNINPKIDAEFDINDETLLKGRELFGLNMTLFKLSAGILSGGVTAGLSIGMDDLLFSTNILVENWHPLGNGTKEEMPTFDAKLGLKWGLNFKAKLAAYIMLGLDIYIASLGGGVEGAAELEMPLTVNPKGRVRGGPKGFWGELEINVDLAAKLNLSATPFVKAGIFGWEWKKDWPFTTTIPLFEWNWGTKYQFGDEKAGPQKTSVSNKAPVDGGKKSNFKQDATQAQEPKLMPEHRSSAPAPEPGAPAVDPNAEAAEKKEGQKDGMPGELGEKMKKYQPVIDGLQYLSQLVELMTELIKYVLMGPLGWIVLIFKMWWYEKPSWGQLVDLMEKTVQAMRDSWAIFRDEIKSFETKFFLDKLLGPEPSLLDALFGADDAVRDEVDKGTHLKLDPEGLAEFINIMMDGCCGDSDEDRILEVLRCAGRRGIIHKVIAHVDGGADQILWKLDGSQDDDVREIFSKYGVDY